MTWLLLALLAPLCWALANVIDTVMRRRFVCDDHALMWGYATFRLPLVLLLIALFGFEFPANGVGWMMLGVGMLWTLAFIPYFRAIEVEEPSRVILFLQLLSVFTLVFGFLILGEKLEGRQAAAFVILLTGGVLAGIKQTKGVWRFSGKAFVLMLVASFFWSISDVVFKLLSSDFNRFIPSFTLFFLGSFVPGPLMLLVPGMRRKAWRWWRKLPAQAWGLTALTLVMGNIGAISFAYALVLGKVALTSVLTDVQPLFVFLLTVGLARFFKSIDPEDVSRSALIFKGLSFAVILAGLWVLYFSPL